MILKNENDLYIYFETIEQLEPQKILDIGMFLKRIGSVSRKVMNREVPQAISLDGVDFFPGTDFLAWKNIYDHRMDADCFFNQVMEYAGRKQGVSKEYDLAVMLGINDLCQQTGFGSIINKLPEYTRYLLADQIIDEWKSKWQEAEIINLQVEEDIYFLLDFGA